MENKKQKPLVEKQKASTFSSMCVIDEPDILTQIFLYQILHLFAKGHG